jgi:hypothetical protein
MKEESSGEDQAGRATGAEARLPDQSHSDIRAMDRPRHEPAKKRSRWKKALALALTPAGAIGAGVTPHLGAGLPSSPRTSTVVPGGMPGHLGSGGAYAFQEDWQRLGQNEAVRRATAVVDLASSRAGDWALGPGARRYFIQLVLAGEGGIDPGEAADVLEFSAEGADLRLGTLITMIRRISPLASQPSEDSPGNPARAVASRCSSPSPTFSWKTPA